MKLAPSPDEHIAHAAVTIGSGAVGIAVWIEWIENHIVIWLTTAVLLAQLVYWIVQIVKLRRSKPGGKK